MLNNYCRVAWRNIRKNRLSSFINIVGLAVGIAVALLIGLWIWDEVSFDSWHRNHARLVQAMGTQTNNSQMVTSEEVAIPLRNELATQYARDFKQLVLTTQVNPILLSVGDKKISQLGMFVQPEFPSLFTLKMLKGSPDALKDPSAVLLSGSLARAFFGDGDPMNKIVNMSGRLDVRVAGVYEDLPQNTTLKDVKYLGAWDKFIEVAGMKDAETQWGNHSFYLYALLSEGTDIRRLNASIKDIPARHLTGSGESIFLHPMDKWHLYSDFKDGKVAGGRIQFVWLFGVIGAFVLLLACINFMNLSTARSEKRAKEVGIRKAIGSLRVQLIGQFLCESLLMALLACALAIILTQASLPFFNDLSGKQMSVPADSILFWSLMLGLTVFTGLIAGSYPAFYLSGVRPIRVLKGIFRAGRLASLPRKVLVVVQFTASIALILGTLVVFKQIQHAKDRPVGYSREGLVSLTMYAPDAFKRYEPLRRDLLQTGAVAEVAESSSPSTHIWNNYGDIDWNGKDPGVNAMFGMIAVTHDFGATVGWHIRDGRDFSRAFPTDSGSFILNETAVRLTGFKHPVGQVMKWEGKNCVITGVVKDLIMESPYEPVKPTIFFLGYTNWLDFLTIRIDPSMPVGEALARIAPVFKRYNAGSPFDYQFVDAEYAKKFSDEQRLGDLATVFAILAIFISCLGLFGLASFVAEQRTKEIGVRKVLGASVFQLWKMLSTDFVRLVLIALLIASPLALYFMHRWLQNYSYRTTLSWWLFASVGAGIFLLTLLTVSFQAIKAALTNPGKTLRTE